ncbi:hypothetical protein GCM10023169_28880 [Georgenia halophila]|uniref:Uncharacterized protein n=1 Tax=Georgenia halophila TaxID=620889 RepID=A0ABP8LFU7_9MICO
MQVHAAEAHGADDGHPDLAVGVDVPAGHAESVYARDRDVKRGAAGPDVDPTMPARTPSGPSAARSRAKYDNAAPMLDDQRSRGHSGSAYANGFGTSGPCRNAGTSMKIRRGGRMRRSPSLPHERPPRSTARCGACTTEGVT